MATKQAELIQECKRLSESCLYTSTSFYIWLTLLRTAKVCLTALGLVLGAVAGLSVLTRSNEWTVAVALCAFVAGLIPTLLSGLKIDDHIEQCRRLAGDFKNLQDRFRQAALIASRKSFDDFEAVFLETRERLEAARSESITPPPGIFWLAQRKVKSKDYDFDVDISGEPDGDPRQRAN